MKDITFHMDAVQLSALHRLPPEALFPDVLSMPLKVPTWGADEYALLVEWPVTVEVELGHFGNKHISCLFSRLENCPSVALRPIHLRTDGVSVWGPTWQ